MNTQTPNNQVYQFQAEDDYVSFEDNTMHTATINITEGGETHGAAIAIHAQGKERALARRDYVLRALQPVEQDIQQELFELITKAGRRCAYDLSHAAGMIYNDPHWMGVFEGRAKYWLTIFDPANGPKDYQSRLMNRAEMAEYRLEKALALLDQHKIDHDIVMPI